MDSTPARKGTVQNVLTALQKIGVLFADRNTGGPPLPRPFLGGLTSGFHSMPKKGDQVAVLHESWGHPVALVSMTDTPGSLPALAEGESVIFGPTGQVACYLKTDGSVTVLTTTSGVTFAVDAVGNVSVTSAAGNITLSTPGSGKHIILNGVNY